MESLVERENTIFNILEKFNDRDLDFILIGGYAVSAFSHRFSVDADIVIREEDREKFEEILEDKDFEEVQKKRIESLYKGMFLSYEKKEELPVNVDLLINSVKCRQTEASWSYDYLDKHSIQTEVEGSKRSIEVKIPDKELLMALKIHSSRLTDARDVVALSEDIDLNKIDKHLHRGNESELKDSVDKIIEIIGSERFKNSYKGVFSEKKLPEENIEKLKKFLANMLENKF